MKKTDVAVVDYQMGNLQSVVNAVKMLGGTIEIAKTPRDLEGADRIILPGVGAFSEGMRHLRERSWIEALNQEVLSRRKPFLGLCLGFQLLASVGTEHGTSEGLNWIPGKVDLMESSGPGVRIPHIGWNDIQIVNESPILEESSKSKTFYFVHSYAFEPEDPKAITSTCSHGKTFVASVQREHIFGTQFHPEKSQKAGLKVLENFLKVS